MNAAGVAAGLVIGAIAAVALFLWSFSGDSESQVPVSSGSSPEQKRTKKPPRKRLHDLEGISSALG